MPTALQRKDYRSEPVLYMAFELSDKTWKITSSNGSKRRSKTVTACCQGEVLEEISRARKRFRLAEQCEVICCYEAGWEGFWLARWLDSLGVTVLVVDSSAIEVNRKKRRPKTDRIDGGKLLNQLLRYVVQSEKEALNVVRVPSREEEDRRRLHREREVLVKERGRHWVRIKSLLRAQGLRVEKKTGFLEWLEKQHCWDGQPLPEELSAELKRQWARHQQVDEQVKALEKLQKERLKTAAEGSALAQVERLMHLKGVGWQGAWSLVMELFSWRKIRNRRQLAALVGLTPTPYSSGESEQEQGISKAGNRRLRALLIELAWLWLRYQPGSTLSQWYGRRFAGGGKRVRRIGIVALARKLLVELWRYVEHGVLPEGAQLKAQA